MQLLVSVAGAGVIEARAVSIPVAVLATWLLNRGFTFRHQASPALPSLARYAAVSAAGASVNFVVYTALVVASAATRKSWARPNTCSRFRGWRRNLR